MGKSQKAQEEGFNLLEESTQAKKEDRKARYEIKEIKENKEKKEKREKKESKDFCKKWFKG